MGHSIDRDCSFEQDGFWFRYRAAAIIIELYYLMKSKNGQQICSGSRTGVTTYNAEEYVRWIPIKALGNYKIFPEFFKDKLLNMPQEIEHFISDEHVGTD